MNIKQTISVWLVAAFAIIGIASVSSTTAYAAECAGVKVSILACDEEYDNKGGLETNGIWWLLQLVLRIFAAGVGIVAVGGVVYGSIIYTSAGGNMDQVKKGITIIRNVVIGLVLYLSMWGLIEFLIPGGVFT